MFYVICGMYYTMSKFNSREIFYGKQTFLGADSQKHYIYEEELTDNTLIFETREEAEEYRDIHCSDGTYCECHIVLEVSDF